jgi:hypothetical protein
MIEYEKTIKMPRDIRDQWLAALRSGEYKQGFGRLKSDNGGYCCLVVLQQVLDGDVERTIGKSHRPMLIPSAVWCERNGITLIGAGVLELWATPSIPTEGTDKSTAPYLNDGLKMPFPEIADVLERHIEVY